MKRYFEPIERMLPSRGWLHGGPAPTLGDLAIYAMVSLTSPKYGPKSGWAEYLPGWSGGFPRLATHRDRVRGLEELAPYFEQYQVFHW